MSFESRITMRLVLENLNFDKSAKRHFLRYFGKLDARGNFLVHDVLFNTWSILYDLRREEILESIAYFNRWATQAHLQNISQPDHRILNQQIEEDLRKRPNVFSQEVVNKAELLLRQIMGIK